MNSSSLYLVAILCALIALSEWLAARTPLRHLGSALLVIVFAAIAANVGLIPPYSGSIPVYAGTFEFVAPLSIFLLLLQVELRGIVRAGGSTIAMFLLGSVGTFLGVLVGIAVAGGADVFGPLHFALGGMFVGTYTGGSVNFNAVALEYGVVANGALYAGAAAVDSAMTTIWMAVTVLVPRLWPWRSNKRAAGKKAKAATSRRAAAKASYQVEPVGVIDATLVVALGAAAVVFSGWLAALAETQWSVSVPSVLILTTLALALAQLPAIGRLRGTKVLGWIAVMFFLAVIGALCDLAAVRSLGSLATSLIVLVCVTVAIHGAVVFGGALLFRVDPEVAAVASQANIGGSTSALALARSLGRDDLTVPAILVGSLGTALGSYLGFLAAYGLR